MPADVSARSFGSTSPSLRSRRTISSAVGPDTPRRRAMAACDGGLPSTVSVRMDSR
jgi:hypothetical protein